MLLINFGNGVGVISLAPGMTLESAGLSIQGASQEWQCLEITDPPNVSVEKWNVDWTSGVVSVDIDGDHLQFLGKRVF